MKKTQKSVWKIGLAAVAGLLLLGLVLLLGIRIGRAMEASALGTEPTKAPEPTKEATPEPTKAPEPTKEAAPEPTKAPTPTAATPEPTKAPEKKAIGALRVEGTKLVNEAGEAVQLRGVSTHGLSWFPE